MRVRRLWNYNPENDDHTGDDWNGENFSWFSQKRALPSSWLDLAQTSPTLDNGGRVLRAVVRPYPAKTAGVPFAFEYELNTGTFTFEWAVPHPAGGDVPASEPSVRTPPRVGMPPLTTGRTEIFVPAQLTQGRTLVVRGLGPDDRWVHDEARQTLVVVPAANAPGTVHRITVSVTPGLKETFALNDFWSDWSGHVFLGAAVVGILVGLLVMWLSG